MKVFDVAIIGSGPAGASAAIKLAEKGIATVIIEKETLPRYKTCGGGFAYRGRRKISKLNENLLPELKTGLKLSKLFYENEKIRNFLIKKYGNKICEGMTQILMGERTYPKDISKQIKKKLRNAIFS